jgi:DNA (cytosine-5)-methyltransferase 1
MTMVDAMPQRQGAETTTSCRVCAADLAFLRSTERPDYESLMPRIRVVDLFCGGGGLSMGVAEAARRLSQGTKVVLAVEVDDDSADVYEANFPAANLIRSDVCDLLNGELGTTATQKERRLRQRIGDVDVLVAGPPCQGHSDLNNHTRRSDPRNALYLRAVRAVEIFRPTFVVVENVPAIQHDAAGVLKAATEALEAGGYNFAVSVLNLVRFGVPQGRRRHVLLAALGDLVEPAVVLASPSPCADHQARTVAWAIDDLVDVVATEGPDSPSTASPVNRTRMNWLLENNAYDLPNHHRPKCHQGEHSYVSMYGRLRWDTPAQTITTGYGSMGQGRFVHPTLARTLTPHEAARLQTLPDFFDLDETKGREVWATVIGNAVPPLLGVHLLEPLLCALAGNEGSNSGMKNGATTPAAPTTSSSHGNRTPPASSEQIRLRMTTTKRRDTGPEIALRSELHRLGLRYRVDHKIKGTRRRVDIAFPKDRVAIYVDGCFWHGCPLHRTLPKKNREWWGTKLESNTQRDRDTDASLRATGWEVLRFWEHDDPAASAAKVHELLATRRIDNRP